MGWPAVGEPIHTTEVMDTIEFLIPPQPSKKKAYSQQKKSVEKAIQKLCQLGGTATKLTLGQQVAETEKYVSEYLGGQTCAAVDQRNRRLRDRVQDGGPESG